MSLFGQDSYDKQLNLLPYDGEVNYLGPVMAAAESERYYSALLANISWRPDQAVMFGKTITTKRKYAWYANEAYSYTYSKIVRTALPWTPELLDLKALVEEQSSEAFNSCLLNLYHSGEEGMAWHSDGEKELKKHGTVASLSFGAERKFAFKHKQTKDVVALDLAPGSLLLMKGVTQDYWLHRLPTTKKVHEPRINLTFRMMNT
ncbi:MAG: alpha-ketoglutarate-dependent dioxygenase AlkB [Enterobacterales bacterium]|nr:alpha-ketoglutarate-dependent dioxygenase AlkB [Enterobacterales bacterium]